MTYGDIYKKAKEVIGEENIVDYRPAVLSAEPFLDGVNIRISNTIMIWLKNGDCIWYKAKEDRGCGNIVK